MKKHKKILLILAVLLVAGNIAFLMTKYQTSLQPTFSENAMKNHPLFQEKVNETVSIVQEQAKALPSGAFSRGVSESTSNTFDEFYQTIKDSDMFRVKVWDRNYTVIWSNAPELIGKRYADNHEVEEALEGEIEIEIKKGKPEHYTERSFTNYSEVYVPVQDSTGRIVGVLEVYEVTEDIVSELRNEFYKTAATSIGISVIIFVAAAFLLKAFVR